MVMVSLCTRLLRFPLLGKMAPSEGLVEMGGGRGMGCTREHKEYCVGLY